MTHLALLAIAAMALGGEPKAITDLGGDFIQHLSWSPDGKSFLLTRIHAGKMGLWTMPAAGGAMTQILPKEANPLLDAGWFPDSKRILFVYDRLQGTDGKFQIDMANADGSEHKNLLPHKAFDECPRVSPDGKTIAFASTRDKNQNIWTMSADGKNLKRLTSPAALENGPTWSPDGKRIAFASGRTGNFEIWVMNADGSEQKRLTDDPKIDFCPVWSPNGKEIAFVSNRTGNYEIFVMHPDGTGLRNLSNHPGYDHFPAWSPDSRRLAWISNRSGSHEIVVLELP